MGTTHSGLAEASPFGGRLARALADRWWLVLLRGIAAIIFGIIALGWPTFTFVGLTMFWGIYALVDGVLALVGVFTGRGDGVAPRWWLVVVGLAGILVGLYAFLFPVAAALILVLCIGAWALVVGLAEIIGAIALRKEIEGEWRLVLSGLLTAAFGAALFVAPGVGVLTFAMLLGLFSIFLG